jgi:hypothetical protein
MEYINDGGPAFPVSEEAARGKVSGVYGGMSQRALFAAILMHAELVTDGVPGEACEALIEAAHDSGREVEDQMAYNAVQCADALLRALAEPQAPAISYSQQCAIDEHPKLIELLRKVSETEAFKSMPTNVQEKVLHTVDEDAIPF